MQRSPRFAVGAAFTLVVGGAAIGVALSLVLSRVLASQLYGVSSALRALRVDPASALRSVVAPR